MLLSPVGVNENSTLIFEYRIKKPENSQVWSVRVLGCLWCILVCLCDFGCFPLLCHCMFPHHDSSSDHIWRSKDLHPRLKMRFYSTVRKFNDIEYVVNYSFEYSYLLWWLMTVHVHELVNVCCAIVLSCKCSTLWMFAVWFLSLWLFVFFLL